MVKYIDLIKNKNECKPGIPIKNNICFDDEVIKMLKDMLIKLSNKNIGYNPIEIVKKSKEKTNCDEQSCIISSNEFINMYSKKKSESIKKKLFKPHGPWNDKSWLSNSNIDEVVNQWEDIYPGHHHFNFKMRDTLKQLDIAKEYKKGMKSFSVVINTDRSDGSGIHWFTIFGDFNDNTKQSVTIEYFNSSGEKPLPEIHEWLVLTKNNLEKIINKEVKYVIVSEYQLQKSSSECGLFSLWYIWLRLQDYSYEIFKEPSSATDEIMYEFRKYIFRKYI